MRLLQYLGAALAVAGAIYLRYRVLVWQESRRDRKADVETLFNGRK